MRRLHYGRARVVTGKHTALEPDGYQHNDIRLPYQVDISAVLMPFPLIKLTENEIFTTAVCKSGPSPHCQPFEDRPLIYHGTYSGFSGAISVRQHQIQCHFGAPCMVVTESTRIADGGGSDCLE